MRWPKREMWKAGIALAGLLLLLVLMIWVPVSAAGTQESASGPATQGTVQATPTEDTTVTALNKEKLAQEVQQLKNQNEPDLLSWLRTDAAILLSTLVVVIGGLIGLFRWFGDRRDAQDKDLKAQAEERFKTAVTALGDEKEGVQLSGTILLRSFLHKGDKEIYGRYYTQIFDLAVAYLRLPRTFPPSEDPDGIPHSPEDPNAPLPLTPLRRGLITVFKESFPLARGEVIKNYGTFLDPFDPQQLDATNVRLDHAYLVRADLAYAWLVRASLREADLGQAHLDGADLRTAHLERANLEGAHLEGADLIEAQLKGANLSRAQLKGAHLDGADFEGANLSGAHLDDTNLEGVSLDGANLSKASFKGANLSRASFKGAELYETEFERANLSWANLEGANLEGVHPEAATSLKDTKMNSVTGLTPVQREMCIKKGAIFDDVQLAPASATSSSSSPPSEQSNDAQATSAPSAQVSAPSPDTGGKGAASLRLDPAS